MKDVWTVLERYKNASEQYQRLKQEIIFSMGNDPEIKVKLIELENVLSETKSYLHINYSIKKMD